jgi:hypothetical protein
MNEVYLDLDADPTTGEGSKLKRMTKVNQATLVTFAGFIYVLGSFECTLKDKIVKRLLDSFKAYSWRLDTVDYYRFFREITRYGAKKWDLISGRVLKNAAMVDFILTRLNQ